MSLCHAFEIPKDAQVWDRSHAMMYSFTQSLSDADDVHDIYEEILPKHNILSVSMEILFDSSLFCFQVKCLYPSSLIHFDQFIAVLDDGMNQKPWHIMCAKNENTPNVQIRRRGRRCHGCLVEVAVVVLCALHKTQPMASTLRLFRKRGVLWLFKTRWQTGCIRANFHRDPYKITNMHFLRGGTPQTSWVIPRILTWTERPHWIMPSEKSRPVDFVDNFHTCD